MKTVSGNTVGNTYSGYTQSCDRVIPFNYAMYAKVLAIKYIRGKKKVNIVHRKQ